MSTHPRDIHLATTAVLAQARARASTPSACACPDGTTDHWFDRSICPDPCGAMHDICVECGHPKGGCAIDTRIGSKNNALYDLLDLVVTAHAPVVDDEDNRWCDECFDENVPFEQWTWPCRFYAAAEKAVDLIAVDVTDPTYEMAFGDYNGYGDDDYDDRPVEPAPTGALA